MTIGIGVIGSGIMGADHAKTLHCNPSGAEVTALAHIDLDRASVVVAELPGVRATDDALALIPDDAVDAVLIAAHDSTHAELIIAAIRAGKPVLCEKPLAPTLAECVEVVREERSAVGDGAPLVSLGFMRRFDPGYVQLKDGLSGGAQGAPLLMHCISRGVSSAPGATNESSVTGSAIHEFDVVPWLLDQPITEVSWHAPRAAGGVGFQDPQLILLRTADGVLSTVDVFLNARYGYDIRCEILSEEGTLALTEPARMVVGSGLRRSVGYAADWRPRFADAYRIELQAWVDAVTTGTPTPLATAYDGLLANAVVDAVIISMQEGGRVVSVAVPALG